jgi:hypothetical protein
MGLMGQTYYSITNCGADSPMWANWCKNIICFPFSNFFANGNTDLSVNPVTGLLPPPLFIDRGKLLLHLKHIFDFAQLSWLSGVVAEALPLAITNGGWTLNVEQFSKTTELAFVICPVE